MQPPDRPPGPADIAALNALRKNHADVAGAMSAVREATGWSDLETSEYIIDNVNWLKAVAATMVLHDFTSWSETEMRDYLVTNRDWMEGTVRNLPDAAQITDVTLAEALRLAALKARHTEDVDQAADDAASE